MTSLIKWTSLPKGPAKDERVIDIAKLRLPSHGQKAKAASVEDKAQPILAEAAEQAQSIVQEAEMRAESIRAEAYNQGYAAGEAVLQSESLAMAQKAVALESEIGDVLERFWTEMEPQLLSLAVNIAKKVVRHEVDANSEFVMDTVRTALGQLRDKQDLRLSVNPADYSLIRERKEDIMASCDGIRSIEVIEDRRVGQGGCMVESGGGTLDARLEAQLTEVERAIMGASDDAGN